MQHPPTGINGSISGRPNASPLSVAEELSTSGRTRGQATILDFGLPKTLSGAFSEIKSCDWSKKCQLAN
jgi:hypothetical protein